MTANYMVAAKAVRNPKKVEHDRNMSWAKKTLRDHARAVRRVARLYDSYLDDNDAIQHVRRTGQAKKKKPAKRKPTYKYGVEVPRTVADARRIDAANGNTLWQDAIKAKIKCLVDINCFKFKSRDYKPDDGFQFATLHLVYNVKQDLCRKARLVCGGHLVDPMDVNYSVYDCSRCLPTGQAWTYCVGTFIWLT